MKLYKKFLNELWADDEDIKVFMNVSAAVIIRIDPNGGEQYILLIRRSKTDTWSGTYETPRGRCDAGPNEDLEVCCKREVKEETGLDIEIVRLIDKFDYLADKGTRKSTQYNYLCRMKDSEQEIKLSKEHDDYKWISSVGEAELLVTPELKKTISKVLDLDQRIVDYPENDFSDLQIDESFRNIWKDRLERVKLEC